MGFFTKLESCLMDDYLEFHLLYVFAYQIGFHIALADS